MYHSICLKKQLGGAMRKFKSLYEQNKILQFLVSYILVLLLPLILLSCGFASAFQIVKNDIEDSYITMLKHSVTILDNEMDKMQNLALQTSQNESVREFAKFSQGDKGYILTAMDALNDVYELMSYQSVELLGEPYIYFRGMNLVMYDRTYYQPQIFNHYLKQWGIPLEEWNGTTAASGRRIPMYQKSGSSLEYVMPFSSYLEGDNQGVLVFRLNQSVLNELLDFSGACESGGYGVIIFNEEDQVLWSHTQMEDWKKFSPSDMEPDRYYEKGGMGIVYTRSERNGWKYVLEMPEKQALAQLSVLKNLVFFLAGAAVFAGASISIYLSVRNGKPINEVFQVMASSGRQEYKYQNLGEAVTGILKNHQELLREMEKDKPAMQKAFFHDLIKAEFGTEEQLKLAARKAGIQMDGTAYLAASFELFAGNDFYEVDEQTLDEVHIISQLMKKHLLEVYPEKVWFYKKNYRISMAIFALEDKEALVGTGIREAREWLLKEYHMESNWGIGHACSDLLLLWKSSEEARIALYHCSRENPVVEYSAGLENIYEFYFPDIAQEKLVECVHSGHMEEAESVLRILEKENCENRRLSRPQFIKMNRKVTDMIPEFFKQVESQKDMALWLNEIIIEPDFSHEEYFRRLQQVLKRACVENVEKKRQQRGKMIEDIMDYMQENYMDSGLGLASVGTVFRVSEGYLSSVFKEHSGINFGEYMEGIRIEKACQLLKDGNKTVNDIASQVGYNSVQSFRRAFKRAKGISPKEARNSD